MVLPCRCFSGIPVYPAKPAIAHLQDVIAWFRCSNDGSDQLVEVVFHHRIASRAFSIPKYPQ